MYVPAALSSPVDGGQQGRKSSPACIYGYLALALRLSPDSTYRRSPVPALAEAPTIKKPRTGARRSADKKAQYRRSPKRR